MSAVAASTCTLLRETYFARSPTPPHEENGDLTAALPSKGFICVAHIRLARPTQASKQRIGNIICWPGMFRLRLGCVFVWALASPATGFALAAPRLAVSAMPRHASLLRHPNPTRHPIPRPSLQAASTAAPAASPTALEAEDAARLRRALLPIWLAVFVQMLGVGVTLSTLPLFLLSLGANANQLGWTISLFSAAQMIGCPLLVSLSNRPTIGRLSVLRVCLTGNAIAAIMTACSGSWQAVTCARVLAGGFAASVPVAQAAVADLAPPGPATSRALTRVASAASIGIVLGPALGGMVSAIARRAFGVPSHLESRVVFACSGLLAACVLVLTAGVKLTPYIPQGGGKAAKPSAVATLPKEADDGDGSSSGSCLESGDQVSSPANVAAAAAASSSGDDSSECCPLDTAALEIVPSFAQPLLRWIALVCSLSITTGIAIYALFSSQFLGYAQPELSLSQSSAAAVALACQLFALPRLFAAIGEARTCVVGLLLLGITFALSSIVRVQPLHFFIFIAARGSWALADVSTAALTASSSSPERRARNLALLQSFQSGSRLVSPLVASYLYTLSIGTGAVLGPPGALPFLFVGALALITAPTPLLLLRGRVDKAKSEGKAA